MGKRNRLTGGTVGRRTILQLSPPGLRSGPAGGREETGSGSEDEQEGDGPRFLKERSTFVRGPTMKATEGLSLLGAYEDSDEEDSGDSKHPSMKSQHNQSADIDSTLANFMAEIDAITTQPTPDEPACQPSVPTSTPPRPEPSAQQPSNEEQAEQTTGTEFQYNTEYSLAGVGVEMGDWQEVWDDNSGCYYYWNTLTNEVSWELPHYLADQMQDLQQCSNSVAVNGKDTAQAGFVDPNIASATSVAPATSIPPKKETKVKEVIESVVALTSEEEDRQGVAASLLGPLIPTEVKEAEEKWRKKLLGGLEEKEESLDSDGEAIRLPGSPSTPLCDPEPLLVAQKDLVIKNQSEENSDAEEETEEDTVELELALERKKAELAALEEVDESAAGSSPCSETSQEASSTVGPAPKKPRWNAAFLHVASPNSNSQGSDAPENTDTGDSTKVPEKTGEVENKEMDKSEETALSKAPLKEEVETPELKFQIGELANTLTSKMEFLGINKKAISNFQLLLLQTETRIADWREGALNGVYLRRKLQEAAEHIKHYELNATPKGWSCHWDREHRCYFYVNDQTSASQWEFPVEGEEMKGQQATQTHMSSQVDAKTSTVPNSGTAAISQQPGASSFWTTPQPPPPETPPPPTECPPPPPPPPGSPPPPPPPPDSDGEIMEVEMEMDDDDDEEPPAPGTEEDGSGRSLIPLGSVATVVEESSAPIGKSLKRKAGQVTKAITIGSSPILYTQPVACAAPVLAEDSYWGVTPLLPPEPPVPPIPPVPTQPPLPPSHLPYDSIGGKTLPPDKTKKQKKDKSKKSKTKMPSLVKKWQSIQKELDEEEKSSSSDEDRDQLNKRTIEEWKQQQLLTGKSVKNANFEALPDDWRERLKKRKMMNST